MIRSPEQTARYLNEAPNEAERLRRGREVFAEQQSILARRYRHLDENGHITAEGERALAKELAAERAAADGAR